MSRRSDLLLEMADSWANFDVDEAFALGTDPWGLETMRQINQEGWDRIAAQEAAARAKKRPWWLRSPPPDPDQPRKRPGWLLFGLGVGIGGLLWLGWRFFRDRKIRKRQDAAAGGRGPVKQEVWVPHEHERQSQLLETARAWVTAAPTADDFELARAVWQSHWPGVPYPRPPHERDHPSLQEALQYVDAAIEVARDGATSEGVNTKEGVNAGEAAIHADDSPVCDEELARIDAALAAELAGAAPSEAIDEGDQLPGSDDPADGLPSSTTREGDPLPDGDEPALVGEVGVGLSGVPFDLSGAAEPPSEAESVDPATLTRSTPTPGYLYMARADESLEDIAATALHRAGLEAAAARGWAPAKAQARAEKLARSDRRRATYVDLIERSSWNAAREDGPLWLPPLRLGALFDRTRRRKVTLASGSWPDGSSKLEPPPAELLALDAELEASRKSG